MWRGIIGNPQFRGKDDEYAAMWLILSAAWKEKTIRVGREAVTLARGECAYALSFLAQAWGCSKTKAHVTLKHLEKGGFIRTRAERGYTRIYLVNYDTYQTPVNADGTQVGTPVGTRTERGRNADGTNSNKDNKIKKVNEGEAPPDFKHQTIIKLRSVRYADKASLAGLVQDLYDHGADPAALMRAAGECSLANLTIDDFKAKAKGLLPQQIQTAIQDNEDSSYAKRTGPPSASRAAELAKQMLRGPQADVPDDLWSEGLRGG